MNETTYDVRVWAIQTNHRAGGRRTYTVRWKVGGRPPFKETYQTRALADSFRSDLISAMRRGEPFDVTTGRPVSMERATNDSTWFAFACDYVDMKWPNAAATYRRSIAEALVTVTCAMFRNERGKPDDKLVRKSLYRWAFNTQQRNSEDRPQAVTEAIKWVERNTRPVADLAEPDVLRAVLNSIARLLDGTTAGPTVVNRKRAVLYNAIEYAVERKLLGKNPLPELKWKAPKITHEVDKRAVANPVQARTLLNAVRHVQRSGARLRACYACSYYAALRPEEAINLRRHNVVLPAQDDEWGEFHLERAAPHAGREWTDNGTPRDERGLKHRGPDEIRVVPIPPELVVILREHLRQYGTGPGGRIFTGDQGGEIPVITYNRVWRKARAATFVPDVLASPLAGTPYSLRHACVSTWLNGGVPATQVAEWAGHSVEVLLSVYAKCLHGQDHLARRRIEQALRGGE